MADEASISGPAVFGTLALQPSLRPAGLSHVNLSVFLLLETGADDLGPAMASGLIAGLIAGGGALKFRGGLIPAVTAVNAVVDTLAPSFDRSNAWGTNVKAQRASVRALFKRLAAAGLVGVSGTSMEYSTGGYAVATVIGQVCKALKPQLDAGRSFTLRLKPPPLPVARGGGPRGVARFTCSSVSVAPDSGQEEDAADEWDDIAGLGGEVIRLPEPPAPGEGAAAADDEAGWEWLAGGKS